MSRMATCLWFDGQAEEAAAFYVSTFRAAGRPASVDEVLRAPHGVPQTEGKVLLQSFTLDGYALQALNGGPEFHFSPATSLSVLCDSQQEVDHFWQALGEGGQFSQCGWLADRYGFSWQIVPRMLPQLLTGEDRARASRVMQAMLGMTKLEIAKLEAA
ncbi:3-demethylubiquinone-9 3-methyltransferase domain protein [Acetobacteraceae bacterium AT-5844]|nr:3-demethylubiquinone-9 3-methyltransferase domain protein [Acetobacteraceae bacterium AT-5844]